MKSVLIPALAAFFLAPAQEPFEVDAKGFIRNWLVLAPIACESEDSGGTEIDKEQVPGEGKIKPKAGDTVKAGGKEIAWKAHKTAEAFIDFRESFGIERGEDAIGYAVAYLLADAPVEGAKLLVGSNDQCKVYLNGKQIHKFDSTRVLAEDEDAVDNVTLQKGQNVLVFKVINEKNNWQGCIRFTKGGQPVRNIKVSLVPQ
jgi:hypothetical protein